MKSVAVLALLGFSAAIQFQYPVNAVDQDEAEKTEDDTKLITEERSMASEKEKREEARAQAAKEHEEERAQAAKEHTEAIAKIKEEKEQHAREHAQERSMIIEKRGEKKIPAIQKHAQKLEDTFNDHDAKVAEREARIAARDQDEYEEAQDVERWDWREWVY